MSGSNSGSNTSKMAVPQAKEAMNRFKQEVASEIGVPLKEGYNGDLTSAQEKATAHLRYLPKICGGFFVHHYVNLKTIECTLYEHSIVMNYLLQNPFCIFCIRIILLQNCDRQFLFSHALRLPHQNLSGNPRLLIQNRLRFPFHGL